MKEKLLGVMVPVFFLCSVHGYCLTNATISTDVPTMKNQGAEYPCRFPLLAQKAIDAREELPLPFGVLLGYRFH